MTEWTNQTSPPTHGPLFQAAMGGTPVIFAGGTVAAVTGQTQIQFTAAHGLSAGAGGDLFGATFVSWRRLQNTTTVFLNAPFTITPVAGSAIGRR